MSALESGLSTTPAGLEVRRKYGGRDLLPPLFLFLSPPSLSLPPLSTQSLAITAHQCICELSTSVNHFNYHGKLFSVLVDGLASSKRNDIVSTRVSEYTYIWRNRM